MDEDHRTATSEWLRVTSSGPERSGLSEVERGEHNSQQDDEQDDSTTDGRGTTETGHRT
jgi:hypothetical protein